MGQVKTKYLNHFDDSIGELNPLVGLNRTILFS